MAGVNYWLLKTEPETFSWQQQCLRGAKGECWSGVRNHQAAHYLRAMALGDRAFFYHTGKNAAIVGIVEIVQTYYPDPTDTTGKFVAVTVAAVVTLSQPVSLKAIKAEPACNDLLLVKQARLSVMPIPKAAWQRIIKMAQ